MTPIYPAPMVLAVYGVKTIHRTAWRRTEFWRLVTINFEHVALTAPLMWAELKSNMDRQSTITTFYTKHVHSVAPNLNYAVEKKLLALAGGKEKACKTDSSLTSTPVRTVHLWVQLLSCKIQHWTVLIIFPLILPSIITAQIMSAGGDGNSYWLRSCVLAKLCNVSLHEL